MKDTIKESLLVGAAFGMLVFVLDYFCIACDNEISFRNTLVLFFISLIFSGSISLVYLIALMAGSLQDIFIFPDADSEKIPTSEK